MRPSGRSPAQMRPISFTPNFTMHAEGAVLAAFGNTQVICTASVEDRLPRWLRDSDQGWITAEYGMLPRATHSRTGREAARGGQGGRTMEIQRLIGRALRAAVDLRKLGPRTVTLDCDVIQADGGTRTASISGAFVALSQAMRKLQLDGALDTDPVIGNVASVSVGIYNGVPVLDLDYAEDAGADTDMNVVMDGSGRFIEVQGTAEGVPFERDEMDAMLDLAQQGIAQIIALQDRSLGGA